MLLERIGSRCTTVDSCVGQVEIHSSSIVSIVVFHTRCTIYTLYSVHYTPATLNTQFTHYTITRFINPIYI